MDNEAISVAGSALPDEHLNNAPADSGSKQVEAKAEPQATPETADQPADSAPVDTAQAGEKEPQNQDAQPQEPPKKAGIQKRIDELTRERYEAQRQAEYWRQLAEQTRAAPQAEPAKPAPRIEDFQDVNQFMDARDAWVREQTKSEVIRDLTEAQRRQNFEAQQHQRNIAIQQTVERFNAQEHDARTRYADYDAAVTSPLMQQVKQVRPDVIQAVIDSPHGPDVAYFLAKNPAKVQQIASLSQVAAAREIGRIEQMFMGQKSQVTNAPEPPRIVGGEAKVSRDPASMSMRDYRAWRSKQS